VAGANNVIGGSLGTTPGGPCAGACNLISGNASHGVVLSEAGATANSVLGNFVGTNVQGTGAIANGGSGVHVSAAPGNTIGGTTAAGRNVLSGNAQRGILIDGAGANGNVVQGNFVGTNAAGTAILANDATGIRVDTANNRVGGTTGVTPGGPCTGACNLVSGNGIYGVRLTSATSTGNTVLGNFIGTNVAGTAAIANAQGGVLLDGAPTNTIGGVVASGAGNLISGNANNGILVDSADRNQILGNTIGTNANGSAPVPNNVGIRVSQAQGVVIGGTAVGAGNVILANTGDGIALAAGATGAQIFGNEIGRAGLGNGQDGVDSTSTSAGNHQIGGVNPGEENKIRFNGAWGVRISNNANTGNTIRGNSIEGNVAGGIQTVVAVNAPVLTDPTGGPPTHTLTVTVGSAGTIDVYLADSAASGQGEAYLVSQVAGGAGVIGIDLGAAVTTGDVVVATLTDVNNNTSEFSNVANVP
jgi:hypothetical protein